MKTVHAWIKRITLRKRCFWFCVCKIQKVKGKPVQFWYDLVTVIGECSVIDVTVERWEDNGIMLILESGNLPFFVQESRFQITRHWSYRNTFKWCLFRYAFGSFLGRKLFYFLCFVFLIFLDCLEGEYMMKKVTIFMLSLAMTAAMLSGCSSSNDSSSSSTAETSK